jgi:hypothetical protein
MDRMPVESANIQSIGYDPSNRRAGWCSPFGHEVVTHLACFLAPSPTTPRTPSPHHRSTP